MVERVDKKFISEHGMDGIWNDMNEPCVFNNDHKTMLETCLHNSDNGVYGRIYEISHNTA